MLVNNSQAIEMEKRKKKSTLLGGMFPNQSSNSNPNFLLGLTSGMKMGQVHAISRPKLELCTRFRSMLEDRQLYPSYN